MTETTAAPDETKDTVDLDAAELFARLKGYFQDDLGSISEWQKEAREDFDFYSGEQWTEEDKQKLKDELRPIITFNRTQLVIDSVAGNEVNNRQEVRYYPRQLGDVKVADIYTAAGEYFRDGAHADDEDSDAFMDCIICGVGWTETRLDFDEQPDGDYCHERVNPFEMVWDASARKSNLLDARRLFRVKDISFEDAKAMFPDVDPLLLDAPWARAEDDSGGKKDNRPGTNYLGDKASDPTKRDRVTIVHAQWKEAVEYVRIIDEQPDGSPPKKYDLEPEKAATIVAQAKAMGVDLKTETVTKKIVKQVFMGGDLLGEPEKTLCGKFSWCAITGKRDLNKGHWFGIVRAMKDPQRWANKWLSQSLHILNSNAKGGVMVEEGAVTDRRQFESSFAKPNAVSWVPNGTLASGRIQPKPQAPMPAGFMQLLEFAVSSVRDVSGINLEMLGMADRDQPGVLEYQRKQSAMTVIARLFDSLRRYRKQQGELTLLLIKDYLSDGRLIRVAGDDAEQYLPLVRAEGVEDYDIIVDEAPTAPNQKEVSWSIIQQMMPVVAPMMTPQMWAEILPYSPLPSALTEKLRANILKIAENPPPNPEMIKAQMEQQKLQMQMQAEQAKTQMQAQFKAEESQRDAEMEAARMARQAEVERAQAEADIAVQQQKAALEMQIASQKFELEKQLKLMEYGMKAQTHRQTMAQKRVDARAQGIDLDDEPDEFDDDGTPKKKPEKPDHTPHILTALERVTEALAASSKPKRILRDANGDVVGVEVVN
jgi:hypothetical protein